MYCLRTKICSSFREVMTYLCRLLNCKLIKMCIRDRSLCCYKTIGINCCYRLIFRFILYFFNVVICVLKNNLIIVSVFNCCFIAVLKTNLWNFLSFNFISLFNLCFFGVNSDFDFTFFLYCK